MEIQQKSLHGNESSHVEFSFDMVMSWENSVEESCDFNSWNPVWEEHILNSQLGDHKLTCLSNK